ncbi:MAG: DNA-formamidopyrimidine glycosylase family protein, partial [Pseudomonadales bacterium]
MPELPEVETTCRGIEPHILEQKVLDVTVRERKLRWPVPENLPDLLKNDSVIEVSRRAKYLLIKFTGGVLMI